MSKSDKHRTVISPRGALALVAPVVSLCLLVTAAQPAQAARPEGPMRVGGLGTLPDGLSQIAEADPCLSLVELTDILDLDLFDVLYLSQDPTTLDPDDLQALMAAGTPILVPGDGAAFRDYVRVNLGHLVGIDAVADGTTATYGFKLRPDHIVSDGYFLSWAHQESFKQVLAQEEDEDEEELLIEYSVDTPPARPTAPLEDALRWAFEQLAAQYPEACRTTPSSRTPAARASQVGDSRLVYQTEWSYNRDEANYVLKTDTFKISDDFATKDWYLLAARPHVEIKDYKKNNGRCGWYTSKKNTRFPITSGELEDYGPQGTVTGSSYTYSVGATVGQSPTVSFSRSETYNIEDVTVYEKTHLGDDDDEDDDDIAEWEEKFRGPDYTWYPWYEGPCDNARYFHLSKPDILIKAVDSSCPPPGMQVYQVFATTTVHKDKLTPIGPVLRIERTIHRFGFGGNSYISVNRNYRPDRPDRPDGPDCVGMQSSHQYTTVTTDFDGDSLTYVFDWGDDSTSEVQNVNSGDVASASHAWDWLGQYNVEVSRAEDCRGSWSDRSKMLSVDVVDPMGWLCILKDSAWCMSEESGWYTCMPVELGWYNWTDWPGVITVTRDGGIIATLAGPHVADEWESYTDENPPMGLHRYCVYCDPADVKCDYNGNGITVVPCEPYELLAEVAEADNVNLEWQNGAPAYDQIRLSRDAVPIAVLGGSAESFSDSDVEAGCHEYCLAGSVDDIESPEACVSAFVPDAEAGPDCVPTLGQWGLLVVTLLLLTSAKVYFRSLRVS